MLIPIDAFTCEQSHAAIEATDGSIIQAWIATSMYSAVINFHMFELAEIEDCWIAVEEDMFQAMWMTGDLQAEDSTSINEDYRVIHGAEVRLLRPFALTPDGRPVKIEPVRYVVPAYVAGNLMSAIAAAMLNPDIISMSEEDQPNE